MKKGWECISIAEACDIKPSKNEARKKVKASTPVSFIPMNGLGIGAKYVSSAQSKSFSKVVNSYTYFADGDVLLAKITPCFENGKLGIANGLTNSIGFGSSEYIVLRPKKLLSNEWLYYYLSRESFRIEGAKKMTGAAGHKRVPKEFIEKYQIPVPLLSEQKRIVRILDEAFKGIETAKANAQQNLQNARELFESHLNEVFTKSGKGKTQKNIGDVCDILNGFAFKSKNFVSTSKVQIVRMGNLYENKLDLNRKPVFYPAKLASAHQQYLLNSGDLVMSLTGTIGKEDYGYTVQIPKCSHNLLMNQRIAKFDSVKTNLIDRNYLLHYLRSRVFLNILYPTANGTKQANLSSTTIKTLPIPLYSLQKQKAIASRLHELYSNTHNMESIYEQKIVALDELKQSLLNRAFNGKL